MAHQSTTDNPYTRGIAEFVSGLTLRGDPRRGPAPHQAADARLARLRALRRRPRVEPHPAGVPVEGGHDTRVRRLGHEEEAVRAARGARQRHRRCRASSSTTCTAPGVLHVGAVVLPALIPIAELRPGMSGKEFLTAAVAGYEIGPRVGLCMGPEHIALGLAFGRHARRVLRRRGRRARAQARRRTRPCTRSASPAPRPRA